MYRRYYDGYGGEMAFSDEVSQDFSNDESSVVSGDDSDVTDEEGIESVVSKTQIANSGIFSSLYVDDLLLIGVLILMLSQDCDDKLMMIIIGFILISGFLN